MKKQYFSVLIVIFCYLLISITISGKGKAFGEKMKDDLTTLNATRPKETVKLVFIHHSVGGRWLAHEYGGLSYKLNENNYYVNDITYGWEPPQLTDSYVKKVKRKLYSWFGLDNKGAYGIGNRTDIGHWYEWFCGPDSELIMKAVFTENNETDIYGDHSNKTSKHNLENPGKDIENEIIMFKSCYPNTLLRGKPKDLPAPDDQPDINFLADSEKHTIANAKRIYNDVLKYFKTRQDKFFVVITAPPRIELPENGTIARGFSNWLHYDWLKENDYQYNNVFVFDLFNVLTSGYNWQKSDVNEEKGNHHRIWNGKPQHIIQTDFHQLAYPRDGNNNHPSPAGSKKATEEFVELLNYYYNQWNRAKEGT